MLFRRYIVATPIQPLEESKYSMRSPREFVSTSQSVLRSKGAYALYAAVGILVLSSLAYMLLKPNPEPSNISGTRSPVPKSQPLSPAVPPVSTTSAPGSAQTDSQSAASPSKTPSLSSQLNTQASPVASNAPVSIAVQLTDRSWLQVVVDGAVKFEGTLNKGTQRNWSAQREITLVAGDAGAVSVMANSGTAKRMGRSGDVKEMTFTPSTR
ncbi:MAG: DUF4115 domain-containing protein [Leptolyngbyaceae cyanobacterium CRU_2_3]|nr:DUF4115 domain-containing protein [Leptolyngbyaceae cyanobacterium CRU_2_3]